MRANEIIDAAKTWTEAGYTVFPEYGIVERAGALVCACRKGAGCSSPGKHGVFARGIQEHGHDGASNDLETFTAIVRAGESMKIREFNIGVATTNVVALDLDVDPARGIDGAAALRDFAATHPEVSAIFAGATVEKTGRSGGRHIFLATPPGAEHGVKLADELANLPGVELKAGGSPITVSPSRHANGNSYARLREIVPVADLPTAPALIVSPLPPRIRNGVGALDMPVLLGEVNRARMAEGQAPLRTNLTAYGAASLSRGLERLERAPAHHHNAELARTAHQMYILKAFKVISGEGLEEEMLARATKAAEVSGCDKGCLESAGPSITSARRRVEAKAERGELEVQRNTALGEIVAEAERLKIAMPAMVLRASREVVLSDKATTYLAKRSLEAAHQIAGDKSGSRSNHLERPQANQARAARMVAADVASAGTILRPILTEIAVARGLDGDNPKVAEDAGVKAISVISARIAKDRAFDASAATEIVKEWVKSQAPIVHEEVGKIGAAIEGTHQESHPATVGDPILDPAEIPEIPDIFASASTPVTDPLAGLLARSQGAPQAEVSTVPLDSGSSPDGEGAAPPKQTSTDKLAQLAALVSGASEGEYASSIDTTKKEKPTTEITEETEMIQQVLLSQVPETIEDLGRFVANEIKRAKGDIENDLDRAATAGFNLPGAAIAGALQGDAAAARLGRDCFEAELEALEGAIMHVLAPQNIETPEPETGLSGPGLNGPRGPSLGLVG